MNTRTLCALYIISRPEERFFFIYDRCLLQDQDDDITKSVLYFDPKFVSYADYINKAVFNSQCRCYRN